MRAGRYRAEPLSLEIPVGPTDRSLLAPRWCLPEPPGERVLTGHSASGRGAALSPDGTLLASGARDGIVRLWDPVRGELTHTLNGHESWLDALAFSPDGTLLASGGLGRTVRLWKRGHGSWGRPAWGLLRRRRSASARLRGPDHVDAVAFSGHGRTLASVTTDSITLWDIASRTALWRARTGARIAAFAPGADAVATAVDAAVGVFDIVDGRLDGAGSRTTPSERITHP